MSWLIEIEDRTRHFASYYNSPETLIIADRRRMARVIRELEGIGKTAQDLINSLREPQEPTNLRKSPVAAWIFAEELRTKLDNLSPDAKEIVEESSVASHDSPEK